ncbi:hypothetical protein NA8A_20137 [Nitratireductor indicus C115]|uniref:Uncharacterized protein n=1 Tax=Nitratireductor indicus C115 TaxID=1231190 RepID=K2NLZ9_9HYPH|nr:hypothetical protein [Nitratireductor indicus]EKF40470.1 hypothetical protein NA8A_20137 [Nitratireductor indicus C115]SFQ50253.1 hypothetical protein SAMN05216176_104367 [Nitratireductor indicus]
MDLDFKNELAVMPDLRHRLRQLRWFRATFRGNARAVSNHYGISFDIDEERLTGVFLDWVEQIDARKAYAQVDRADFIIYAAGLCLKEMIRHKPASVAPGSSVENRFEGNAEIVRFWPEGFLYTNYCVCAIAAIFEQEFGAAPELDRCADDLRTWWSYKENTREMPASAVAFLDRFLGAEPNWVAPDLVEGRLAMRLAIDAGRKSIEAPSIFPEDKL